MSDGGFAGYDSWKCTEPAPTEPDALDLHDEYERAIDALTAENKRLRARIAELEAHRR